MKPKRQPGQPATIAEAARHYRVNERTIRRRIAEGKLKLDPAMLPSVRIILEATR